MPTLYITLFLIFGMTQLAAKLDEAGLLALSLKSAWFADLPSITRLRWRQYIGQESTRRPIDPTSPSTVLWVKGSGRRYRAR